MHMKNLNLSNKNNATKVISSLIYCGLVSGYQGDGNTATPQNAAEAVSAALGRKVLPGVCVYHTDWGCPSGGEPVGAYRAEGTPEEILSEAEKLRKDLRQTTLSVGLPGVGEATIGFEAYAHCSLLEAGAKWQEAAARCMQEKGVYVSCGMAEEGNHIVISAEANPAFVQDLNTWKEIVKQICVEIGADEPTFNEVGFNYLKDAE